MACCIHYSPKFLFLLPDQFIYIAKNMCVAYAHFCVDIGYELPLLPNNTGNETFLHKSGAVLSVDWIIIIGAPAWRWLGEYVTLDKMCYRLIFKQEVGAAPRYFHISFLFAFLEEVFVRNIIIILWIYYTIVIIISISNNNNAIISINYGRLSKPYFVL
jgi:hypothetical protein